MNTMLNFQQSVPYVPFYKNKLDDTVVENNDIYILCELTARILTHFDQDASIYMSEDADVADVDILTYIPVCPVFLSRSGFITDKSDIIVIEHSYHDYAESDATITAKPCIGSDADTLYGLDNPKHCVVINNKIFENYYKFTNASTYSCVPIKYVHPFVLMSDGSLFFLDHQFFTSLRLLNSSSSKSNGQLEHDFIKKIMDNVVDVSCYYSHSGIVDKYGQLFFIGNNRYSQCGIRNSKINIANPTKINLSKYITGDCTVKNVSCGEHFTLILLKDGRVASTGSGYMGQTGQSHQHCVRHFTVINDIPKVKAISSSTNHSLLLLENGRVMTFGCNDYGKLCQELDDDVLKCSSKPIYVNLPHNRYASMIATNFFSSIILLDDGSICFYGLYNNKKFINPFIINFDFVGISAENRKCYAVSRNGKLYGIGKDSISYFGPTSSSSLIYEITFDDNSSKLPT